MPLDQQPDPGAWDRELFRLLVENVKDSAIFIVDSQRRVLTWNVGAQRLLGYSAGEIIGQSADCFYTPQDIANGVPEREIQEARATGRVATDRWQVRKDGVGFWCSGVLTPLPDAPGHVHGFAKILHDRTVLKLAEKARRQSEASHAAVLQTTLDCIIMMDHQGRIVEFNPAAEKTFGYRRAQVIGRNLNEVIIPPAQRQAHLRGLAHYLATGESPVLGKRLEISALRSDGSEFEVELSITRVPSPGPPLFSGYLRDISDRRQAEQEEQRLHEELRQRMDQLAEADRRKDEFLATLAHELRNPLAPIRNALEIMQVAGDNEEVVLQARQMMERQVRQMVRLVDDLLDVSRITRGTVELRKERVELSRVVTNAVETSLPLIEACGHELSIDLPSEPLYLNADPTRLAQVLANLLNNSAKYTAHGGHIRLSVLRHGSEALVKVSDNGIGIPHDMLPRIFDMFTQVDRSQDRSRGGLGIGLTLVRSLVEMHGGIVEARSEGPGRGCEVIVRLPAAFEDRSEVPLITPGHRYPPATAQRRILVVDDNRDSAESLATMLALWGNNVRIAYDGLEAVDVASSFSPTVILLDIGMPKLNGHDAARQIRAQDPGRRILLIAMTGWGQEQDIARSKEAGFDHHLVKPVDPAALQKLLE